MILEKNCFVNLLLFRSRCSYLFDLRGDNVMASSSIIFFLINHHFLRDCFVKMYLHILFGSEFWFPSVSYTNASYNLRGFSFSKDEYQW